MPSDALAQNLGRLNNSLEKIFPLLNAVVNGGKDNEASGNKGKEDTDTQVLDKNIKALSSGVFMSVIIDNVSSKEVVTATDAMKKLLSTADGISSDAVDSFKRNVGDLTVTINSINIGNAKAMINLRNYIASLSVFVNTINSLDSDKFDKAITTVNSIQNSIKNLDSALYEKIKNIKVSDLVKSFNELSKINFNGIINSIKNVGNIDNSLEAKARSLANIVSMVARASGVSVNTNINGVVSLNIKGIVKRLNDLADLDSDNIDPKSFIKAVNDLAKIKTDEINIKGINNLSKIKVTDIVASLNKLKDYAVPDTAIQDFVKAINDLGGIENININAINSLKKLDLGTVFNSINVLSGKSISEDSIKSFVNGIKELNELESINARKISRTLKAISSFNFNAVTNNLQSLKGLNQTMKKQVELLADIVNSFSKLDNFNVKKVVKNINNLSDLEFQGTIRSLKPLSKLDPDLKNQAELLADIVNSFSKLDKFNARRVIRNINRFSDLELQGTIRSLKSLSKLDPDLKKQAEALADIVSELGNVGKINARKVSKNLAELSKLNINTTIKKINKIGNVDPNAKNNVSSFTDTIQAISALGNINLKAVNKAIKDFNKIRLGDAVHQLSQFNNINKSTKDGASEFVKIIESLDAIKDIDISKSMRKLKRLFKGLNSISEDIEKKSKTRKGDIVNLSGLADFIEAAKTAEKINTNKANKNIRKLKSFFQDLNEIVRDVILADDSPFANKSKRKDLDDTVKLINKFMEGTKGIMATMAINSLLGLPALVGFGFTYVIYLGITSLVKKLDGVKIDPNVGQTIRSLTFIALAMSVMTITIAGVAIAINKSGVTFGNVIGALGLMVASAAILIGIQYLIPKNGENSLQGVRSLAIFALVMVGVTGSIILMSKMMEGLDAGSVLGTLGLMTAVALVLVGIGGLASLLMSGKEIMGVRQLAVIALTMVGVSLSIMLMAKLYETVDPGSIWATFGLMTATALMLVGIGGLAGLLLKNPATLAAVGGLAIIALVMVGVTAAIVNMAEDVNRIGFGPLMKTLGLMGIVATALIGVGALLGWAVVLTGPALLGAAALAAVSAAMVKSIKDSIKIHKLIEENPAVFEMKDGRLAMMDTLVPVVQGIMELGDYIGETSLGAYIRTKRTLKLANKLINTISKFINVLVKFDESKLTPEQAQSSAQAMAGGIAIFINVVLETMTEVENVSNKTIRKTRRTLRLVKRLLNITDDFLNIISRYSPDSKDNRDIIGMAESSGQNISRALLGFVNTFFEGFEGENGLHVYTAKESRKIKKTLKNIERLVDIVPAFLDSIKKMDDMMKNNPSLDIGATARTIADTVKEFTNTLFTEFDAAGDPKKIKKQIKNFKNIIKPVTSFVDMITGLTMDGDGKISKVVVGEDGKVISTPGVDMKLVSTIIADSVVTFLNTLYSNENVERWKKISGSTSRKVGKLLKVLDPINSFIDLLSKYNVAEDGALEVLDFNKLDSEGNPTVSKKVNVGNVAGSLAQMITDFMDNFYSQENIDRWDELSGKNIRKANRKIGKLTTVIEPLSSFTDMLSKFGSNTTLYSIDPETGEIKQKIDVAAVAGNIAGAVTIFVNELYSHESEWNSAAGTGTEAESQPWYQKLWNNVKSNVSGLKNQIKTDVRLGKFAQIVDPINTFMQLMTSYKWNGSSLEVLDGDGKTRIVDFAASGKNIATAINTFVNAVYDDKNGVGTLKDNSEVVLNVGTNFETAFETIDDILSKSNNDKRIREIKRLSDEFKKLSENIDKMVSSADKVSSAIDKVNVADGKISAGAYSGTPSTSAGGGATTEAGKSSAVDYNKLSSTVSNAISTGIKSAFNSTYKFEATCQYNKTLDQFTFARTRKADNADKSKKK